MAHSANGHWERARGGFERGLIFLKNCYQSTARGKLRRSRKIRGRPPRDFAKPQPEFPRNNPIFAGLLNGCFCRPETRWPLPENFKKQMFFIEKSSKPGKYRIAEPLIWFGIGPTMISARPVINSCLHAA